jgi:DNA-binding winged helix-turn-helix (wHTH) protein
MACFHPWQAFRRAPPNKGVTTNRALSYEGALPLTLPCGQCIGCRMSHSDGWAVRLTHEAHFHEQSCFVTLTFNDDNYPWDASVSVRDLQLFLKRLRKAIAPIRIRFFACAEYGDENGRPHYHLIIFGWNPPDRQLWRKTPAGFLVYRSHLLEKVWPFGHVEIGEVTTQSAGYVARYALKKVTGSAAREHYTRVHAITGEILRVRPEFIVMSTRPGIGYKFTEDFERDAFPKDFVVVDGRKRPVPAYHFRKFKQKEDSNQLLTASDVIKSKRKRRALAHSANNTPERLSVREEVLGRRAAQLKRSI